MEGMSDERIADWSLYNNFAKQLKPGCSKKYRKKLMLERTIPGVKEDEL